MNLHRVARCLVILAAGAMLLSTPSASLLRAQTARPRVPLGGFAADRLARLDRVFHEYINDDRLAGATVMVMRDGQPAYVKAFGWADKEARKPMAVDTLFRIASQTKAVTSTAVMQLIEDGRISLNQRVGDFIPSFAKTTVLTVARGGQPSARPAQRAITVRDLLTHTSGISYGTDPGLAPLYQPKGLGPAAGFGWYSADKDEGVCTTMERLGTLPFASQPGEQWVYGYSTDVLGCIVERASGMPLDDYIRTRITGPLRMKDTQFFVPVGQTARLAAVYASGPGGKIVRAPIGARGQGHYVNGPRRNFSGGAGLVSTAPDYARFLEMIRLGGTLDGVRILSPRSVRLMATNQVGTLHSSSGLGWGLAFETIDAYGANGMSSEHSFGWGGAYGSIYRIDPDERLSMLLMIQLIPNATDIREKFPTLVYQALE